MSEWQIDERGRLFRQIAPGHKEYAMEFDHPRAIKKNEPQHQDTRTGRECPFDQVATMERPCRTSCALYRATGCAMKRREAVQDTNGKPCPFLRKCGPSCALYDHGCTL